MKSPHGQPSPALLRSIHRPYLRHNGGQTGGHLPPGFRKTGATRVFPAQLQQKCLIAGTAAPHHALLARPLDLTNI
jgi:hypothetical protein